MSRYLTVLLIVCCTGCVNSYYSRSVVQATMVATPTFSPPPGSYSSGQQVTIADTTAGASIFYTTNGTLPTTSSAMYIGPITVSSSVTIQAIGVAAGYTDSAVATGSYVVVAQVAATPTFSPPAGTYTSTQQVTLADTTPGAAIYYTTNGTTPTMASALYSGPITVSSSETIEAFAVAGGYQNSATGSAAYVIVPSSLGGNEWTWISGSNTALAHGVYGTQGVSAPGNVPGAREENATWTDTSGNLWLFGGLGLDAFGKTNYLNDLWKFNPATSQWTWVNGSNAVSALGIYGSLGVASPTNVPGARTPDAFWVDSIGRFWLFGGGGEDSQQTNGVLNDVWMFDPTTSMWTWEGGNDALGSPGLYGTQGVSGNGMIPGARIASAYWTDSSGNFWLFGGNGIDSAGGFNTLNDLWRFDAARKQWTWMSGSKTINAQGVYGAKGVIATANMPGARQYVTGWADSAGKFWIFGGETNVPFALLNDLWQYDPVAGEWTWVSGDSSIGSTGTYGTKGVAAAGNTPGDRYAGTGWADRKGNLYLFGGTGDSAIGNFSLGSFNDLWKFSTTTGEWTWLSGSNAPESSPNYGTLGVASPSNVPGSRYFITGWTDATGNFWLFGGTSSVFGGNGLTNDLWRYQP